MKDMLERIYAGFLGMNIGIRLGAPVEPAAWDFERIAKYYGDIRGYVKNYKNFAADDDVNGPVYFLRGYLDNGLHKPLTPQAVGEAWLNYARNGIGLYWWGGEGVSTEHTAYLNLKRGIPAPQSGSIAQNGIVLAEQIGGQIFIDTWGLIALGDPHRAAELARTAASVSHDGNGLYGAAFIAACIASAYEAKSVGEILEAGLKEIPQDSTYAQVVRAVWDFYRENPEDYRKCMTYLIENWGYDKYPGVCHIIPNAGVCVLAMLYGEGDLSRTVEIATMCGWDTDCNAGNVGTILGVYQGLGGIPAHYREPINDFIVLSGISGYLNILDVPTYAKFLYQVSRITRGLDPDGQVRLPRGGELLMDFALPGSTHGLRLSNTLRYALKPEPEGLGVIVDRILPEDSCDVYYKPFYRREDFDDERYKPVFSPTVYSGQTLTVTLTPEMILEGEIVVRPYVLTAVRKERLEGQPVVLEHGKKTQLRFRIPHTWGDCISQLGFHVEAAAGTAGRVMAVLHLQELTVTGKPEYSISTLLCREEFLQQTPFSLNEGKWSAQAGWLHCRTEVPAQAYTGNYYTGDVTLSTDILAAEGSCLMLRAAGACRYTAAGFLAPGKVGLRCHNHGDTEETLVDFPWEAGRSYHVTVAAEGNCITLLVDGELVLSQAVETISPYGMVGFAQECPGTGAFRDLHVRETGEYEKLIPNRELQ